jgi:hypothetical protein
VQDTADTKTSMRFAPPVVQEHAEERGTRRLGLVQHRNEVAVLVADIAMDRRSVQLANPDAALWLICALGVEPLRRPQVEPSAARKLLSLILIFMRPPPCYNRYICYNAEVSAPSNTNT